MSISCSDVVQALARHLKEKGYAFHNGDVSTGETVDDESGEDWWFTWTNPEGGFGTDIVTGPTCYDELEAQASAMDHFFENACVPVRQ